MMLGSPRARLANSAALAGSHWPAAAVASSQDSNSMSKVPTLRLTSSMARRTALTMVMVCP